MKVIPEGTTLTVLDGQHISVAEFRRFNLDYAAAHCEWNAVGCGVLLVRPFRTKYGFINHSRRPNLRLERDPLRIVAATEIGKGAELTLDYRNEPLPEEYLLTHGVKYL
ncbi:SET domain-containing protein-lysine N-methyltransferase [Geobacter grbiciae]|nr:SET domain-containing protein-lysine N-methyltransferase [Geobacter grbiciae]